ncbi:hypothetical protein DFQ30_007582 [Apophysomyces sp. BC1015]|nr:hypothetical protein DFQ30_007582 [Apophysomyces sp. BC1015]KAG0175924.1 hypothetical protein DFQ29_006804 [Apophysomyces sp. BC1021]
MSVGTDKPSQETFCRFAQSYVDETEDWVIKSHPVVLKRMPLSLLVDTLATWFGKDKVLVLVTPGLAPQRFRKATVDLSKAMSMPLELVATKNEP